MVSNKTYKPKQLLLTLNSDIGAAIPRSTLGIEVCHIYDGTGTLTVQPGASITLVLNFTAAGGLTPPTAVSLRQAQAHATVISHQMTLVYQHCRMKKRIQLTEIRRSTSTLKCSNVSFIE